MKKTVLAVLFLALLLISCARTWTFQPLETYKPAGAVPPASACQSCHDHEYATWKETLHGDEQNMARIPVEELRQCGACHEAAA